MDQRFPLPPLSAAELLAIPAHDVGRVPVVVYVHDWNNVPYPVAAWASRGLETISIVYEGAHKRPERIAFALDGTPRTVYRSTDYRFRICRAPERATLDEWPAGPAFDLPITPAAFRTGRPNG